MKETDCIQLIKSMGYIVTEYKKHTTIAHAKPKNTMDSTVLSVVSRMKKYYSVKAEYSKVKKNSRVIIIIYKEEQI